MNTAGGVCLSVLSSLLAVAGALAALSALALAPLSTLPEVAYGAAESIPSTGAEGGPSPISSPCSSLVAGVLYGSFSLRELFPFRTPGCSWSLENPDPTKYSLYLRFTRNPIICQTHHPMLLSLDHHLANQSCPLHLQTATARDQEIIDLCGSPLNSDRPYSFLQFDKNFVQLCLTRHPAADEPQVTKELAEQRLVEVLLINNENSSQFTCGVLCRWFEECLRTDPTGNQETSDGDVCGMTQTGCICPNHNIMAPPIPLLPETPHSFSNGSLVPDDCCVTELHSNDAIAIAPRDVKTQRPRSADLPGVFQAQTGDPAAEEWSPWSVCSLTCGQGWQVRTRSCVSSPYGTLCSGALRETRMCNNTVSCPVEGQWLEWGAWSKCSVTCNTGTQMRQRRCSPSVHGWAECKGLHQESRECANPSCSNWGSWNHWSLCSKTCDSGWQRRYRMCEGSGEQGYPCEGSGEEVRSCNEKKCPAPHEICKDEHLLSMSWKRASAGETVYNKCPTNVIGSASRRCMLDNNGVAFWGPPSFARCVSLEYRQLHLALLEHLAKGQRTLAGEGMSQIVRSLLELLQRRSYYSGDLLFSTEILRNVTDTFKRATYIPASDDVQKFFQIVSHMLDLENLEKWEDAHQVAPGAALLMRILEDFIHFIGEAQKPFQSFLTVTNNLMITIQREPVSAVSSDINFPMKGRRGMKDWARTAEDKLYIPKEVFTIPVEGKCPGTESETTMYYVIGAILYRTLGIILPGPNPPAVINSKILTVTVRPEPQPSEPMVVVELSPLLNGTSDPQCVVWNYAGTENWGTEGCQTLASNTVHTKCLCSRISTYAVLAQQAKDPVSRRMPSVPLMVGCGVSCTALLILLLIYAAFWRYIRSERSIILVNFCFSILASNLLILLGQSQTLNKVNFLSSFCLSRLIFFSLLACVCVCVCLSAGLPALVVAVSVGFTRARGYGTASYCWLSLEGGLLYAFVGPAAVIVLVNMLIGIVVFNKLMSRDGISDKSKKQRAGASLWSSCVVLPLLALTWMSAVLAITDRRSTLFQVLFAVFDSVQGFVIITVHCAMRREVQDAVRCRMGGCKDDSENSPDSCKNGQVQIMTDFEKDVDLACQTVIFKEVNTCNPATITGTLSRISLDDEDDPKLAAHQEGGVGVNFSSLPGNIPPPNLISGLGWARPPASSNNSQDGSAGSGGSGGGGSGGGGEGDYMVLPRRTVSLKPPAPSSQGGGLGLGGEDKPLNIAVEDPPFPPPPSPLTLHPAESEAYPADFVPSSGHVHSHGGHMHSHAHSLHLKPGQRPSVRQILTGGTTVERTRTLPRNLGSTNANTSLSAGSLEVSEVMHTRKRHSELYHELNHSSKFHTIDRYNRDPAMSTFKVRLLSRSTTQINVRQSKTIITFTS
uniref:Adhesion G protein-coupled receptor B2 n=1 Tax=Poecilia latipinna TaxID=48699 RepID=A0A3B3U6Y6_9TELE